MIYGIIDYEKHSEYSNDSFTKNYFIPSPFEEKSPLGLN